MFIRGKQFQNTQTQFIRWIDRLLPFDYENEHIPDESMGFLDYISRHSSGRAETVSELDNLFVVAQLRVINWLIAPAQKNAHCQMLSCQKLKLSGSYAIGKNALRRNLLALSKTVI